VTPKFNWTLYEKALEPYALIRNAISVESYKNMANKFGAGGKTQLKFLDFLQPGGLGGVDVSQCQGA
jgi:hypothetical protein